MADNEEVFKLLIQAEGQDILPKLQAQLAATNDAFGGLAAAFGRGEVDEKAFAAQSKDLADQHRNLAKAIKEVEDASGKGSSKLAGFGQAALQSGRVVQDFAQGGIGGILNNIEGLTMALGLGSGLAGVLTIAGVGLALFKDQIKDFWEALSGGDPKQILSQFETLSARIKELKEQPLKFAVDRHELDEAEKQLGRIKEGQAEFEARQKKQTVGQAESGKLVDEALTAAGPEFEDKLRRKYINDNLADSGPLKEAERKQAEADAEIRAAEDAKRDATTPEDLIGATGALKIAQQKRDAATKEAQDVRDAIEDNAPGQIGKVTKVAVAGNDSADYNQAAAQKQLAKMLRDTGQDKLASQVERANPGRLAQIDALNKQGAQEEAAGKIAADAEKARDEAAKAKRKADGAPMDDAVRAFKGEQEAARARRKADGAPMDDAVRAFKGEKKDADARQKEAMARAIYNRAGGQLTPDQSRDAAGEAQKSMQQMGQFGRTQMGANQAMYAAMNQQLAAMQQMMMRIEQQAAGFTHLGRGFNQLHSRANERQPTALRSGGP